MIHRFVARCGAGIRVRCAGSGIGTYGLAIGQKYLLAHELGLMVFGFPADFQEV